MSNRLVDNLILKMSLAGNALETRAGNNGTWGGTEAYSFDQCGRQIANFEGTVSYVQVPHNANQLLTGGFSISFKAKADTSGEGSTGRVISKTSAGIVSTGGFHIYTTGTNYGIVVDNGSAISAGTLVLAQEYFLTAAVASDGVVQWYINGIAAGTGSTNPCSGIIATNAMRIGAESDGATRCFDGLIGDVSIHNVPLTAAEAATLYLQSQQNFVSQRLKTALIGDWKLNGNAKDYASGNTGVWGGTESYTLDSKGKYIADFNGTTSYVEVAHNANQLLTSGFSINFKMNPRSVGETTGRVIDKSTGTSGENGFRVYLFGTQLFCQINAGTLTATLAGSVVFNKETYCTVTCDSLGNVVFYMDGIQKNAVAGNAPSEITTTNAMRIGNRSLASDRTFNGLLGDLSIHNVALTASEAQQLYREAMNPTRIVYAQLPNHVKTPFGSPTNGWGFKTNEVYGDVVGSDDMTLVGSIPVLTDGGLLFNDNVANYTQKLVSNWRGSDAQGGISFWFKRATISTDDTIFCSCDTAGANYFFLIRIFGNKMEFFVYSLGAVCQLYGSTTIAAGQWYHAAVFSNGSTTKIYVNAIEETLTVNAGTNAGQWLSSIDVTKRDNIALGVLKRNTVVSPFSGIIRELAYYPTMTANDVVSIYRRGVPEARQTELFRTCCGTKDLSPYQRTITRTGNAISTPDRMLFDGVSGIFSTPDMIGLGEVTVSFWALLAGVSETAFPTIVSNDRFIVYWWNGRLLVYSNGSTYVETPATLVNNVPYRFVVVRKSTGATTVYRNGSVFLAETTNGAPSSGAGALTIGNRSTDGQTFNGSIWDLSVKSGIVSAEYAAWDYQYNSEWI